MNDKIIARGAEAVIIKQKNTVIKDRIEKSYRHPILDGKLRKLRTRAEAKLLEKASKIIPVPKILKINEQNKTIELEYIRGKKLADSLEKLNYKKICNQIGQSLAKIHDAGIIHGDLTTSNMIYVEDKIPKKTFSNPRSNPAKKDLYINNYENNIAEGKDNLKSSKVYFIDFGLGFHSQRIEDKAVDLHLIKQALEAKHPSIYEKAFSSILQGYKLSKNYTPTIKQLEKVEKRGRYKAQY